MNLAVPIPPDWSERAEAIRPQEKQLLSLRIDSDIVAWFKAQGPGYQSHMNNVLRIFMLHHKDP